MNNKAKKYTVSDLTRKTVYVVWRNLNLVIELVRKLKFYFLTKCWTKHILGRVYVNSICMKMQIGENATLYPYTIFEVAQDASLIIGNNFTLSYGALIACNHSIQMGNDVMIGEYTSIRDSTHGQAVSGLPYKSQQDTSEQIIIGNNVWIGRGTIVLPGSIIDDGVIIGAHSLVKGHLNPYCVYAGSPLKLIKELAPAK